MQPVWDGGHLSWAAFCAVCACCAVPFLAGYVLPASFSLILGTACTALVRLHPCAPFQNKKKNHFIIAKRTSERARLPAAFCTLSLFGH